MTNSWTDIKNADLIIVMGGNAAEAHPVGFKWVVEAMQQRKAKLISVDPRFNRTSAVADFYAPIRNGTDIAFLGGVINWLLSNDKIHREYVKFNTDATFLTKPGFHLDNGIFSGYDEAKRKYDKSTWGYQLGEDGYVLVDDTMQDPLCVYQQLKKHYSRYTPELVSNICGTPQDKFLKVCEMLGEMSAPDKTSTILYALGWTQHSVGSQNIRTMAMIQLLLGNMGRPGGGVNALRGHSNVQGVTDMNAYAEVFSGYLSAPTDNDDTYEKYLKRCTPKPMRPNQFNYWSNFPRFFNSLMKSYYGKAATPENNFCFDWVPKLAGGYDALHLFELMHQGKMNGFIAQGFNPLATVPNKNKLSAALSKLKFLVVIDPLESETGEFWKNFGPLNDVKSEDIPTEVFRLPSTCFAEEEGSLTNSSRIAIWKERAVDPLGEAKPDSEIMALLFMKLRAMYAKDGGALPEPIANLAWDYTRALEPSAAELLREINGKALSDVLAPPDAANPSAPRAVLVKAGQQVPGFAMLRDDGSTACGNWLYSGCWTEAGNLTARRNLDDPSGLGVYQHFGFAWPANRRILYNRASADPDGKAWAPNNKYTVWNGKAWSGPDVPDMMPTAAPEIGMGSFIMNPEGVARLHAMGMADGPFPEHYEPFETPIGVNPLHPDNPKAISNPAARVFKGDLEAFGKKDEFPYSATTYRLTEHFHTWTKHARLNAVVQPEAFVEIGEELAKEKGIAHGDKVKVSSNRGHIVARAVVTKRIKPFPVNGQKVHLVGIPFHWGFKGQTKPGYIANTLTPFVGDANSQTPEFKAFLVNVERA
jgi:formate dehydrogenase-N alpha subunit